MTDSQISNNKIQLTSIGRALIIIQLAIVPGAIGVLCVTVGYTGAIYTDHVIWRLAVYRIRINHGQRGCCRSGCDGCVSYAVVVVVANTSSG